MVPEWFSGLLTTAYTVVSTVTTLAATAVNPALGPVVGGAFAITSSMLDTGLKGVSAVQGGESENQIISEQLESINGQLVSINGTLIDMRTMISENSEMLRDIKLSLQEMEEKMDRNFASLKLFMVEKDFVRTVKLPMTKLWKSMEKATDSRTIDAVHRFIDLYKKDPARSILESFILGLEYAHSNPISAAMEHDVLYSKQILDNYMHILAHLIVKVYAIEGFYFGVSGLSKNGTAAFLRNLDNDVNEIISSFHGFVKSYKIPLEKYWPEAVKQVIVSDSSAAINYDQNANNMRSEVADRVKQHIEGIHTTDLFSIYVYSMPMNRQCQVVPLSHASDRFSFMVEHVTSTPTRTTVIVLRSEKYREVYNATAVALVRTGFRSYAQGAKGTEIDMSSLLHKRTPPNPDPYLEVLDGEFSPNPFTGFVLHGCTRQDARQIRFTDGATEILTEGDMSYLKHRSYFLSWM